MGGFALHGARVDDETDCREVERGGVTSLADLFRRSRFSSQACPGHLAAAAAWPSLDNGDDLCDRSLTKAAIPSGAREHWTQISSQGGRPRSSDRGPIF